MAILPAVSSSAMHGAVVPIARVVADGSFQSAIFYNVPQTYQDLMIVHSLRSSTSGTYDAISVQVNNTLNIYSDTFLTGNGTSATSNRDTSGYYGAFIGNTTAAGTTTGIFSAGVTHILNYANSTTYKTLITRVADDQNGSGYTTLTAALIRSTSPLTQINIYTASANIATGSTVTLYGIRTVGQ
jgi:hypothetical protein